MKVYLAFVITLGISASIIAGSLILFLWIATKFDSSSFEYKAARIATVWVDVLISLGSSYYTFGILSQAFMQHKRPTTLLDIAACTIRALMRHKLTATILLVIVVCIITVVSYKYKRYWPVFSTSLISPFIVWGIWYTGVPVNFDTLFFYTMPAMIISVGYIALAALPIFVARREEADALQQAQASPQAELKQDSDTTGDQEQTAFEQLTDIIEQGVRNLGVTD